MKRILSIALLIVVCAAQMTSCIFSAPSNDYMTHADVENLIAANKSSGGDTNYVNITVEGTNDVISASKAVLSTVSIKCKFDVYKMSGWFPSTSVQEAQSAGSGVIYKIDKTTGDAYIITNYHVIYNSNSVTEDKISDEITLYLYGMEYEGYAIPAKYVGGSMTYDIAILKVEGSNVIKGSSAVAVEFTDSDSVELLESVVVIGNANGKGISATAGYISVDSEYITMLASDDTTSVEMRVMRTSAPINSGNYGGGMFNAEGKLLGITNAKIVDGQTDNIGFAIPSNIVKYVSENIMYYCDGKENKNVKKCILGVDLSIISSSAIYDETTGKVSKQEAVAVKTVSQDGIANGILQVGDVINKVTIDGVEYVITRQFNVIDCMLNARVGSTVVINITRGGTPSDAIYNE